MEVHPINVPVNILIYKIDFPLADTAVDHLCRTIDKYGDERGYQTNLKSKMTHYDSMIRHYKEFKDIFELFAAFFRNDPMWNNSKFGSKDAPFVITDFWGALYEGQDHAVPHMHGNHSLSFVYFLKTEDNPAPLLFHDDRTILGMTTEDNPLEFDVRHEIVPEEGTMIVFPSHMWHSVRSLDLPPGKRRYILSGNVGSLFDSKNRHQIAHEYARLYSKVYPLLEDWRKTTYSERVHMEAPDQEYLSKMWQEKIDREVMDGMEVTESLPTPQDSIKKMESKSTEYNPQTAPPSTDD